MEKETGVYSCNEIAYRHEKEVSPAIYDTTDGPQGHFAKWSERNTNTNTVGSFLEECVGRSVVSSSLRPHGL